MSKEVLTFHFSCNACNDPEGEHCCPHDAHQTKSRGWLTSPCLRGKWGETWTREQSCPTPGAFHPTALPVPTEAPRRGLFLILCRPFPPWGQEGLIAGDLFRAEASKHWPPTCLIGIQPHPFTYCRWLLSHYNGQVHC